MFLLFGEYMSKSLGLKPVLYLSCFLRSKSKCDLEGSGVCVRGERRSNWEKAIRKKGEREKEQDRQLRGMLSLLEVEQD